MNLKRILSFTNVLLLVISFFFCLYINVHMNVELGNNPFGRNIGQFFVSLIPFVLLMIMLFINLVNNHKKINSSIIYKVISIFGIIVIIFMECRALFDKNMVLLFKTSSNINFDYFTDQLLPIKLILYGLCLVNIIYIVEEYLERKNND